MALLIGLLAALTVGGSGAARPPAALAGGGRPDSRRVDGPRFDVPHFDVKEHHLENGLVLLLLEDHSAPIVTFQTFFAVGSADERSGATGAAHFLEHLMFDGAEKYGPKEFDRRLEQAGGSSNAVTTLDLTAFHEEFPPEALDLVLDLERDRMQSLALADSAFDAELETVREERRLRSEEDIEGSADELLYATAFVAHPYRWPTVGWMADLERLQKEEIRQFWHDYYRPENCTVVVVGDFKAEALLPKLRAAFSGLKRGSARFPPRTSEPPQRGERRIRLEREAELPMVLMGWHAPAVRDPIWKSLRAAQLVLSGIGSARLDEKLVNDSGIALSANAALDGAVDPGLFEVSLTAAPGHTAEEVEQAARAEIEKLATDGPTADELVCARANETLNVLRELETVHDRAFALGHAQRYLGDWRAAFTRATLLDDVTAAQVQAAVATLLVPQNLTVVTIVPTPVAERSQ
jgi:zinc protease